MCIRDRINTCCVLLAQNNRPSWRCSLREEMYYSRLLIGNRTTDIRRKVCTFDGSEGLCHENEYTLECLNFCCKHTPVCSRSVVHVTPNCSVRNTEQLIVTSVISFVNSCVWSTLWYSIFGRKSAVTRNKLYLSFTWFIHFKWCFDKEHWKVVMHE